MPKEPLARALISGISAEICLKHLFPPELPIPAMPAGYRLVTVEERARSSARFAALLAKHPDHARFRIGSLCFVLGAPFRVNDKVVRTAETLPMAFWWAAVAPEEPMQRDPRVLGTVDEVQLATWYPNERVDRSLILTFDPMGQFAPIEIESLGPAHWRVSLTLQDGRIEGEIRGLGDRRRRNQGSAPSFMTVPSTGAYADYFTVFAYSGHYSESTSSSWHGSGTALVVRHAAIVWVELR